MSMGLAVAGNKVGALPEILGSDETLGGDNAATAARIVALLDDPAPHRGARRRERRARRAAYDVKAMVAAYDALYADLLGEAVDPMAGFPPPSSSRPERPCASPPSSTSFRRTSRPAPKSSACGRALARRGHQVRLRRRSAPARRRAAARGNRRRRRRHLHRHGASAPPGARRAADRRVPPIRRPRRR